MIVGVAGTTRGLTPAQRTTLRNTLLVVITVNRGRPELHHGDCIGVDQETAEIARELGYWIIGRPEKSGEGRAYVACDKLFRPIEWSARNRRIVNVADLFIGCPAADEEWPGSGTWHAINYARSSGAPRLVISPSGRFLDDNNTPE